jgi:ATP-binding cassette, subfamily B, bacterial MsbA
MTAFLLKLWAFVRPYRARFFLGLVCGILYGLANGLLVAVTSPVVDMVFHGSTHFHDKLTTYAKLHPKLRPLLEQIAARLPEISGPSSLWGWLLVFSIIPCVMLLRVVLAYLSIYLTNWAAARAIADIRTKLFDHMQNLSLSFFSRASTGDLISRITNDTQILYGIIGSSFSSMVKDPVTILTLVIYQLTVQWKLTLISVLVLPVCVVPIIIFGRKVRKSARAMQGYNSELTNLMHEAFTGNRIIKAYNLEDTVLGQFRETTKKYVSNVMRVLRSNEIPSQMMELLGAVGIALIFLYVQLVLPPDKRPGPEDFTAFLMSVIFLYPPIKAMTRLHNQLNQAAAASSRVFDLLETKSTIVEPPNPVPLVARNADIHFESVDFDYDQKPVLRNINLSVKAGQLIALVGRTGSGKTTITNLLLRFYDPQKGAIKIGPTDLRQVSTRDLRNKIALVTQETILFNDTIRHNIALGRPGATDAEIEAAAQQANAHEFIIQKEGGYEFMVGEKGVNVSGGQRQRIAIARAILRDAPILILDEATSALDSEVERAVQAELEKLMQGRTTICIAHRLSTIQRADLIVVLSEGRIVETGTHAELLQRGGVYKKLYDLQFQV